MVIAWRDGLSQLSRVAGISWAPKYPGKLHSCGLSGISFPIGDFGATGQKAASFAPKSPIEKRMPDTPQECSFPGNFGAQVMSTTLEICESPSRHAITIVW